MTNPDPFHRDIPAPKPEMDADQLTTYLGVLAGLRKIVGTEEARAKRKLAALGRRRTEYPTTDTGEELATVVVRPKRVAPEVLLTDESVLFPWAIEQFGDNCLRERPAELELTEQAWESVRRYAATRWAAGLHEEIPPGVEVAPPDGELTVSVTPASNSVELLRGMHKRGQLSALPQLLELEG